MREFDVSAVTWPSSNFITSEEAGPVITVSPWLTWSPMRNGRAGAGPVWTWVLPVAVVTTADASTSSAKKSANKANKTEIFFMVLSPCQGRVLSNAGRVCAARPSDDMRCRAYHVSPKSAASPEGYALDLRPTCDRWRLAFGV